jgi:uncharacterized membrane protein
MPTVIALALLVHLLCAIFWIGGMATLHTIVRPAVATEVTEPLPRLRLMRRVVDDFVRAAGWSVLGLWVSGLALVHLGGGWRLQPPGVHAMATLALVMTLVYGWIRWRGLPRLREAVQAGAAPVAAEALAVVRARVLLNLVLGVLVCVCAVWRGGF